MNIVFAGGIISILAVSLIAAGYAKVFDAPKKIYIIILCEIVLVVITSQFLPDTHLFHMSVYQDLTSLYWIIFALVPIGIYILAIRWIRRKISAKHVS